MTAESHPLRRRTRKLGDDPQAHIVIRMLRAGHRPGAVDKALGLRDGMATELRSEARKRGCRVPTNTRTTGPVTVEEYRSACRFAGIEPDPTFEVHPNGISVANRGGLAWPHLEPHARPAQPRNAEAGLQAERIRTVAVKLRHVPPSAAGGGESHFGRECAEHLADLIAYAPGPRYLDDPRGLIPEPRIYPEICERHSSCGSSSAMCVEVAA